MSFIHVADGTAHLPHGLRKPYIHVIRFLIAGTEHPVGIRVVTVPGIFGVV